MKCDRCGTETSAFTCSMFNTDDICTTCEQKERKHPQYPEAVVAEARACESGNYNFPGIGLPNDLRVEVS